LTPYAKSVSFTVSWSGSDNASGIDHYDIYYSVDQGSFTKLNSTTNTSTIFTGQEGHRYGFYSVAFDKAGNSETKSMEEAWTRIDATAPVTNAVPLPKYVNSTTFDLAFNVTDASPTNVTLYYKKDIGTWTSFGNFSKSPIPFTSQWEGLYEFYTEGIDAAGNKEVKGATAEASTIVDLSAPSTNLSFDGKKYKFWIIVNVNEVQVYFDSKDNNMIQDVKILFSKSQNNDNTSWGAWVVGHTRPVASKGIKSDGKVALAGDGWYRLRSGTTDAANNTENGPDMIYLRVDTVAPQIASSIPADGARNVSLSPDIKITFSESMNRPGVEKAISIANYTGNLQNPSWDSTSTTISFSLAELTDNMTYTITVSSMAKDTAGNALKKTELSFTTVPTRGGIVGKVMNSENVFVKGAKVVLRTENGTKVVEMSTDATGSFGFNSILAGNYTISVSASGHDPSDTKVTVVAGMSVFVPVTLQKNNMALYLAAGGGLGALVFFLLLFFLVVVRKKRKCPQCGTKLKKKVEICPKCGVRVPLYQAAAKSKKRLLSKKGEKAEAEAKKGEEGPPPVPVPPGIYAAPKTQTKCPSCKEDVPAGEEWCPNCGAMVAIPEGAQTCPKCGGTMGEDGVCFACGFSHTPTPALLPEQDMHEPGKECPRCYAPLESGAKFCAICGGDVEKLAKKQKQKEERIATMKEDARPGAKIDLSAKRPEPPPIPAPPKGGPAAAPPIPRPAPTMMPRDARTPQTHAPPKHGPVTPPPVVAPMHSMPLQQGPRCRTCNSAIPAGSKWCDVCGEKV
jgi:predicted amidophosphoribosyltransferase